MAGTSAPPAGTHYSCVSGIPPYEEQETRKGERGKAGREKGREEERKGVGKGPIEKVI